MTNKRKDSGDSQEIIQINFRLSKRLAAQVRARAEYEELSQSEFIRSVLKRAVQRKTTR